MYKFQITRSNQFLDFTISGLNNVEQAIRFVRYRYGGRKQIKCLACFPLISIRNFNNE